MNKSEVLSLNADVMLMRVLKYRKYVKLGLPDVVVSSELEKLLQCLCLSIRDVRGINKEFINEEHANRVANELEDSIRSSNGDTTYVHASINSELLSHLDELILFKKFQDEEEEEERLNEEHGVPDINKAKWTKVEEAVRKELENEGFFE